MSQTDFLEFPFKTLGRITLAYPLDSNVRELVGHLGYGAVAGTMLSAVRGLGTRGC
jgi:hypothetical protein